MVPALLGGLALAKGATGLISGLGQSSKVRDGMDAFKASANQGIATYNQGKQASDQAFNPYTGVGSAASGQLGSAARDYKGEALAGMPQQQTTTAQGTQAWLDPSAAYSMDQANRATQASALAKGGMGGGLAKALSNNANKMAMTNWNNAYNQQLGANAQNFNQGNQLWQNKKSALDTNINNLQGVSDMGLTAQNANQGNQLAYNQGINSNYMGVANSQQSGNNQIGKLFADTANNVGNNLVSGISSIWGGK